MLVHGKFFAKIDNIRNRYNDIRFKKIQDMDCEMFETLKHFRKEPTPEDGAEWVKCEKGAKWGGNYYSAWFKGNFKPSPDMKGKKLLIHFEPEESLLFVDGITMGVLDGFHKKVVITQNADPDHTYHIAIEAYSGHFTPGSAPNHNRPVPQRNCSTYNGVTVYEELTDVTKFVFDLWTLRSLTEHMDDNNLRKAKVIKCLEKVFSIVDGMPEERPETSWRSKLPEAIEIMKPYLETPNGPTVPYAALMGHSHIDTAWHWPLAETWRKCARTFSSVLNLMNQYPDMTFLQPASCHTWKMRELYPELFERITQAVKEGRWEPNGAMWVEPDCNLTSGESMVRQLLVGQTVTKEMFGYTSDTLWEPDTFGYSASMPQMLQSFGVKYFCTTKMDWNDTTRFPFDTFKWAGIDGTEVITHLHAIHTNPEPKELQGRWNRVIHKDVQETVLATFGHGDGGGGPNHEMLELAQRTNDLEGCPKTNFSNLSDYMELINKNESELPVYNGEMYLELHRGTLTSIAKIKRGNRKSEIDARNAEMLAAFAQMLNTSNYPKQKIDDLWKELLTNQFHDILPGSSIAHVNDEAIKSFADISNGFNEIINDSVYSIVSKDGCSENKTSVILINTLNWERKGNIVIKNIAENMIPENKDIHFQKFYDIDGNYGLVLNNITIKSLGSLIVKLKASDSDVKACCDSNFKIDKTNHIIQTPLMTLKFTENGSVISLKVKQTGEREYVMPGGELNKFVLFEDIPEAWDNWDTDREYIYKRLETAKLVESKIINDGPLQLKIRSKYTIGDSTSIFQDMTINADSLQIDYDIKLDWNEVHRLLKTEFELNVRSSSMKNEIQYGYLERPTHSNTPYDAAKFEVCNHKWTDISDNSFGAALLNDCKYGISGKNSTLGLTLIKAGTHPDTRAEKGTHYMSYSLLPHIGPFSTESVIRPAYEMNMPVISKMVCDTAKPIESLLSVDSGNIIIETIKWAEDGKGMIIRMYDSENSTTTANITFNTAVHEVCEVNMMEETVKDLSLKNNKTVSVSVNPFEIKTLRLSF